MSRPTPPTYKTRNWPSYNEALKRRGSLTIWFDPEMSWEAAPTGRRGRQQSYSDAAIQTCLSMKVLFGMALRQTTGFVESLLQLVGLDCPTCLVRSRRTSGSAASPPTVPTTHVNATTPLPTAAPMPSSRPARTRSPGRRSPLEPWHETRPCARRNTWAARSGDDGADTTAEAASRQRCIV